MSATLHAVRQPLRISRLTATVSFGDTTRVEVDRLETERSVVFGSGWVSNDSPPQYSFQLSADPIDVEDLRWLPIPLPESASGPMGIDLASRGSDVILTVSDGDLGSEDTRIRGGFSLALAARPRFEDIDLRLEPLRLAWLDRMLEREGEIDGWVRGVVRGSGRLDDLTINADVTLEDLEPGTPASILQATGAVGLVEPIGMRGLELNVVRFEPRWARIVGLDPGLGGRVDGTLTLDRSGDDDLAFVGELSHLTPAGDLSQVSGSGTVDFAEDSFVDVAFDVHPLALAVLRPWIPEVDLAGAVSGPIRVRGDLGGLSASATLQTERGRLTVDGTFDLASEEPRYDAQIEATDLSLDQWLEGAPASRLAVRGRVNGVGFEPATLDAAFDLEILPSELDQAEIYDSRLRFRLANGLATIDTLFLDSDVGVASGRGRFGLTEGQLGTLEFEAAIPDLSALNRWFVEEIPGEAAAEAGQALFESFEAALGSRAEEESTEGLAGSVTARGVAVGRWEEFTVEAFVEASGARFEVYRADSLSARVRLLDPPGTDVLVTQLTATGVDLDGRRLDSLAVRIERSAPGAVALDLHARRDSTLEVSTSGEILGGDVWDVRLDRLRVRLGELESVLVSPARLTYSDSALVVDGLALTGALGRVEVHGRIPAAGDGEVLLELFGVRVDQLGYLFSEAPEVGGTLGGSGRLVGTLAQPRFAGTLRVTEPSIRNQRYSRVDARLEYSERRLEGVIDLLGEGTRLARLSGSLKSDLALEPVERRLLDDAIDLHIRGDSLPLALVELNVEGLEEISGVADADITLQGAPGDLRSSGGLTFTDGRAWVPDLGVWLTEVGGRIEFRGSEARLDSAYVASDLGGSVAAVGTIDIASLSDPEFDLDLSARDFHAVSRLDLALAVSGDGRLGGSYTSPVLTGSYRLSEGDIRHEEFLRSRDIIDLSDPTIYTLLDSAGVGDRRLLERFRNPFMENLVVDAEVSLGPNLWLRSEQFDVEVISEGLTVYVDRARDSLSVSGGVTLQRGTYRFDLVPPYVQSLRITSGAIQFVGGAEFNPNLAIAAEYRNRTTQGPVVIEAQIGGTLRESTLDLSSTPPMSETDQVCFLAVGAPCYLSADRGLGGRLIQETFLGTLSSGISSALVGSTGLSYFNLRSIGGGEASSGLQGSRSWLNMTAVEFGWYANQDLFLSFSQPLGGGLPRATVEWTFLPYWTLEARVASRFDEQLFGLSQATNLENEQTFGLFLFRDWDFGSGGR